MIPPLDRMDLNPKDAKTMKDIMRAIIGPCRLTRRSMLTERQLRVLGVIMASRRPMTFREIGKQLSMSLNGVRGHLIRLKAKGLIAYEPNLCRTIRPTCKFIPV